MTKRATMNLRAWWDAVGTANVQLVIDDVGSSMAYFRLLKYGLKKPGATMSMKIIDAARRITPGFEPDLELLLRGAPKNPSPTTGRLLPPSPEFVRAQKRAQKQREAA